MAVPVRDVVVEHTTNHRIATRALIKTVDQALDHGIVDTGARDDIRNDPIAVHATLLSGRSHNLPEAKPCRSGNIKIYVI